MFVFAYNKQKMEINKTFSILRVQNKTESHQAFAIKNERLGLNFKKY